MTPAQKRLQAKIDKMVERLERAEGDLRRSYEVQRQLKAENQDLREAIREIRYMAKI